MKEICGYKLVAVSGSYLLASATDSLLVATAERVRMFDESDEVDGL